MNENDALKKAKEELDNIQKDEYEQRMAELRQKHIMNSKAIEEYGYDKGLEEGLKKGTQKVFEIVKKLFQKGKSIEEIIELTDLTEEDIKKILTFSKLKQ